MNAAGAGARWKGKIRSPGPGAQVERIRWRKGRWNAWIDRNQISRRNLTKEQRELLMVRIYGRKKKAVGAPTGNQNAANQLSQNATVVSAPKSTAEIVAAEFGVSPRTVTRAMVLRWPTTPPRGPTCGP